jgi:hypothetical protein
MVRVSILRMRPNCIQSVRMGRGRRPGIRSSKVMNPINSTYYVACRIKAGSRGVYSVSIHKFNLILTSATGHHSQLFNGSLNCLSTDGIKLLGPFPWTMISYQLNPRFPFLTHLEKPRREGTEYKHPVIDSFETEASGGASEPLNSGTKLVMAALSLLGNLHIAHLTAPAVSFRPLSVC